MRISVPIFSCGRRHFWGIGVGLDSLPRTQLLRATPAKLVLNGCFLTALRYPRQIKVRNGQAQQIWQFRTFGFSEVIGLGRSFSTKNLWQLSIPFSATAARSWRSRND